MSIELPPLPAIFEPEKDDEREAFFTQGQMLHYVNTAAERERILLARLAELEADAERYRSALDYAMAQHYGRLSPAHNHWINVAEKAMADAARGAK